MIRVARFELDPRSRRARAELLQRLFLPRSRRERWWLRLLASADRAGLPAPAGRLVGAASVGEAPPHGRCLEAARDLLGEAGLSGGLDLLPAPHAPRPVRVLLLWRGAETEPFAVAKAGDEAAAPRLAVEAAVLRELAATPPEVAGAAPRLLAEGASGGLRLLVQSRLPGRSLARALALRRAGAWPPACLRRIGASLGALHASGRLHGDAWGRNLLVDRAGRPTGWVDHEAGTREGSPAAEALRFLLATARADLLARGPGAAATASDDERLARWVLADGPAAPAGRAFLAAWRARLAEPPPLPRGVPPERAGLRTTPSDSLRSFLDEALMSEDGT